MVLYLIEAHHVIKEFGKYLNKNTSRFIISKKVPRYFVLEEGTPFLLYATTIFHEEPWVLMMRKLSSTFFVSEFTNCKSEGNEW